MPGCVWLYWLPVSKWESWTTLAHVLHVLMLTRTKWRRHCWRQWWWRCRLTHIPWQAMVSLINKRVGKTDSVALTSGRYVITGTCTLWQLPVFVHVKLIVYFFFLPQVHYWLGSGSGHYKLGTGPIPLSSMYIDHTRHSTCTYTMMYKGQKQLCCNLFCNYFVSLSPHITLILATGTFLFQCRLATHLAPKWEQPYSRATVVGALEITVCDHSCRWSETARKAPSLSVWLFSCQ